MGRLVLIIILISFNIFQAHSQNLKRIAKSVERNEFDKVKEQLNKTLIKDTAHFGAMYFYSLYYLDNSLRQYHLDSARHFILKALNLKETSTSDQQDDWAKTDLPLSAIDSTKIKIIRLSYTRALDSLSVSSVKHFLSLFPDSHLTEQATYIRDSLAYQNASEIDTWKGYKSYVEEYPGSPFRDRASAKYDVLLFKDQTRDGHLDSYIDFLKKNPETPYRRETEEIIYKKMTLKHEAKAYVQFLRSYPDSHLKKRAADKLYYLFKANESIQLKEIFALHPKADSLKKIHQLESLSLTPISFDGAFSFMDSAGNTLTHLKYELLDPEYKCGNVRHEWLRVKSDGTWVMVNRNGFELMREVFAIEEIGDELMLVRRAGKNELVHQSGFPIADFSINDAAIVFDQWIAFAFGQKWGIMSFKGEVLLQPEFESIKQVGAFLVLEKGEGYGLVKPTDIVSFSDKETKFSFPYDDYEVLGDSLFLGYNKDMESLIDQTLEVLLPLKEQHIYLTQPIWYVKTGDSFQVFDRIEKKLIEPGFAKIEVNEGWLGLKRANKWTIRGINETEESITLPLDSVYLLNASMSYIERRDSSFLFFSNGQTKRIQPDEKIKLLATKNNSPRQKSFAVLSYKTEKSLLNDQGEEILNERADDIQYLNDSTFIVKIKGKYGLYQTGKGYIQRATYDLINENDDLAILLKNNQIGCIDLKNDVIVPALYESRIERFSENYLVSKKGKKGVLSPDNKLIIPIDYDELLVWTDTSYWARTGTNWSLKTYGGQTILDNVLSIRKWNQAADVALHIFMKDDKYGIIHPKRGILIPPMYNDILNVGTETKPIYFAEEHLKTAEFFVVTYFNHLGKAIKSQAYRAHEYDLIYCER